MRHKFLTTLLSFIQLDEDQLFIQRTLEEERRFKERKERNGYNDDVC